MRCNFLRCIAIGLSLAAAISVLSSAAAAAPVNGEFSAGLSGWTSRGAVQADQGECQLQDAGDSALLWQTVPLSLGVWDLDFELLNGLSSPAGEGESTTLPDAFFASLYLTNDLTGFDPANPSGHSLLLMEVDYNGPVQFAGRFSASPKGADWQRFSTSFTNAFAGAVIIFELLDLNSQPGDSQLRLDNIKLSTSQGEIPEPSSVMLLGAGLVGAFRRRHGRRAVR